MFSKETKEESVEFIREILADASDARVVWECIPYACFFFEMDSLANVWHVDTPFSVAKLILNILYFMLIPPSWPFRDVHVCLRHENKWL